MSHWNYRIVKYRNGDGYGLHEVHYDDDGLPYAMTKRPTCFVGADPKEIVDGLVMARTDARKRPVFDQPKKWPGKAPW